MSLLWILLLLCVEPWEQHYSQGRALAQQADWKQAEVEFRQVASANPAFLPGRLALGTVLEQTGDWAGAESEFRAALLLDSKSAYALAQLAQTLVNLRRSGAAIPYWKQAAALEPENLDFPIGLAAALFEAGDAAAAQQTLQALATAHPAIEKVQFSLGNLFAGRGIFADAAEAYQICLKLDPAHDEARLALIKALLALDRHREALDVLSGRREDFDTVLLRGGAWRGLGEDGRAAADLSRAVQLKPGDYDARYNLGFVLFRLNRAREAKEQLELAAQLRPDATEARYRLALVLKSLNETARAQEELRHFEQSKKQALRQTISASALASGNEMLRQGDARGAASKFQEAIRLDPRCAECQGNLGVVYAKAGDTHRAEELFRGALKVNPQYGDAHLNLGLILAQREQYSDAEKELLQAPPTAASLTGLGMVQTKLAKPEAAATFRKVVALNPGSAEARLNLGIALADTEQLEAALAEFTEALRLVPTDSAIHYNRGRVLKDLGRVQDALPDLEAAQSMPEALFLRAAVEQQLEHRDRAIALLRQFIAAEPRNPRALFLLGQNLQESGKDAEAIAVWKQSLEIDPDHTESLYALFRALSKSDPQQSAAFGARFTALKKENQTVGRAETLSNFALASVAAKDFPKAISQLKEALQVCGDCISQADLHKNLGLIECQSGDIGSGEQELRLALRLARKDKPADADIEKALKVIADLRRAPAR